MQQLFFFIVVISGALFGCVFLRFQFKPLRELMPQRGELQSEGTAFFFGVIANVLGIGLYEALVSLKRPAYTALTLPLTPVSMRTILLGAAIGTIGFISIRMIMRRRRGYPLRRGSIVSLTRAAFVALTVALALELSIFNLRHYDMLLRTDITPTIVTRGSFELAGLTFDEETQQYSNIPGYDGAPRLTVRFDPIKVHTIQLNFSTDRLVLYASIFVADEAFRYEKVPSPIQLTTALPRSLFLPIHSVGESPCFTLIFSSIPEGQSLHFRLDSVVLNAEMPFRIEFSRILFLFLFIFIAVLLRPSGFLSRQTYNEKDPFQRFITVLIFVIILIGLIWTQVSTYDLSLYVSKGFREGLRAFTNDLSTEHNEYAIYHEITDAFLAGQLSLLDQADESILNAEFPYDPTYRAENNIVAKWDRVYFQGKYYSYFGIAPVILAFLPFKALTGLDMPVGFMHFLLMILILLGVNQFLKFLFKHFFKTLSANIFYLSFIGLISAIQIPALVRVPFVYQVAIHSGITFSLWSVYFMSIGIHKIFSSEERDKLPLFPLFGAGICFGLAVASRPTTIFIFLWLMIIALQAFQLMFRLPKLQLVKIVTSFGFPILVISLGLMIYNYNRFGSILEFGTSYQMSRGNGVIPERHISPSGIFFNWMIFLFQPLSITFSFPFITTATTIPAPYIGYLAVGNAIGLFSVPWFYGLALIFSSWKNLRKKNLSYLVIGAFVSSVIILFALSATGTALRYLLEFAWIFAILSLLAWLSWLENERSPRKNWAFVFYFVTLSTAIIAILLSLTGDANWFPNKNPLLFEQLRYQYSFWL